MKHYAQKFVHVYDNCKPIQLKCIFLLFKKIYNFTPPLPSVMGKRSPITNVMKVSIMENSE